MALNVPDLVSKMLAPALPGLKASATDAESYAKSEFEKIAQSIVSITEQLANGTIDQDQAKLLLDMQKNASTNVLKTVEGLGLLAAEAAINAAIGAVKDIVNHAIGFALIA